MAHWGQAGIVDMIAFFVGCSENPNYNRYRYGNHGRFNLFRESFLHWRAHSLIA
jgi:hypothetical protein